MKNSWLCFVLVLATAFAVSCSKTSFIESADAVMTTSADILRFDTVFTTTGSVTQYLKIFNRNDQKLRLSNIALIGAQASAFKINVDGTAGTTFSNVELEPNDSLYVFVSVSVNPNSANLPFIVRDSIQINYNGKQQFVQLEAYGQNANFFRNARVTKDSSWNNQLPFVILGSFSVDENVTLNINKGCRIYCHANAPIIINGSLKVNGEKYDSTKVTFQGDRMDAYYRDFPGSWPGIYFTPSSRDNVLNFAIIKNAYQGIVAQLLPSNSNPKVTLNETVIDNIYEAGILSINSSISARNCLITNCGNNVALVGGKNTFTHCTIASYSTAYLSHKNPVLFVTNAIEQNQTLALDATFTNCIFWGEGGIVDDEILVRKEGSTPFNLSFQNILYRAKNNINPAPVNSIKNQTPLFDSIDANKRYFDFRLQTKQSPAIDKGVNTGIRLDLDGNGRLRGGFPDIGSYEKQ